MEIDLVRCSRTRPTLVFGYDRYVRGQFMCIHSFGRGGTRPVLECTPIEQIDELNSINTN